MPLLIIIFSFFISYVYGFETIGYSNIGLCPL